MAINLTQRTIPPYQCLEGSGTFTIAAGKTLKLETSPDGEEIIAATVPSGKLWTVHITVNIEESDI